MNCIAIRVTAEVVGDVEIAKRRYRLSAEVRRAAEGEHSRTERRDEPSATCTRRAHRCLLHVSTQGCRKLRTVPPSPTIQALIFDNTDRRLRRGNSAPKLGASITPWRTHVLPPSRVWKIRPW